MKFLKMKKLFFGALKMEQSFIDAKNCVVVKNYDGNTLVKSLYSKGDIADEISSAISGEKIKFFVACSESFAFVTFKNKIRLEMMSTQMLNDDIEEDDDDAISVNFSDEDENSSDEDRPKKRGKKKEKKVKKVKKTKKTKKIEIINPPKIPEGEEIILLTGFDDCYFVITDKKAYGFGKNIGDRITFQIGDAKTNSLKKKKYAKVLGNYVLLGSQKSTIIYGNENLTEYVSEIEYSTILDSYYMNENFYIHLNDNSLLVFGTEKNAFDSISLDIDDDSSFCHKFKNVSNVFFSEDLVTFSYQKSSKKKTKRYIVIITETFTEYFIPEDISFKKCCIFEDHCIFLLEDSTLLIYDFSDPDTIIRDNISSFSDYVRYMSNSLSSNTILNEIPHVPKNVRELIIDSLNEISFDQAKISELFSLSNILSIKYDILVSSNSAYRQCFSSYKIDLFGVKGTMNNFSQFSIMVSNLVNYIYQQKFGSLLTIQENFREKIAREIQNDILNEPSTKQKDEESSDEDNDSNISELDISSFVSEDEDFVLEIFLSERTTDELTKFIELCSYFSEIFNLDKMFEFAKFLPEREECIQVNLSESLNISNIERCGDVTVVITDERPIFMSVRNLISSFR